MVRRRLRPVRAAWRRLGLMAAAAWADLAPRPAYRTRAAPLCLVSHDAYRHGAQLLALSLARMFARRFGLELYIVLLGSGPLAPEFRRYGRVHQLAAQTGAEADALAKQLCARGVRWALCNSAASGLFVETLTRAGVQCVSLVHELPAIIAEKALGPHVETIRRHATLTVFPNCFVRDRFPGGPPACSMIRAQGASKQRRVSRADARALLARRFGVPEHAPVVLNVGYGDLRKGVDLFIAIGARVTAALPETRFVWLGELEPAQAEPMRRSASKSASRIVFAPFTRDTALFYAGADLFALTSREDPFPSVLLEAQAAGLPAVAFKGVGGFEELLARGGGVTAPNGELDTFAGEIIDILRTPARRTSMSTAARAAVNADYSMLRYAFDLAHLLDSAPPRVSAIVPNYNYARYLPARLDSILRQTLPVYEIIVIDDCSTDNSRDAARAALRDAEIPWRVIEGEAKSPSVFRQWRRGIELAQGDFVWIAEADDLSDPAFLATAAAAFFDQSVVMSYTQSRQIDQSGRTLDTDYLRYVSDIGDARWRAPYVADGHAEIANALAAKNTIPNVSACVFRRAALLDALSMHATEIERYRIAGDWMAYVRLLAGGRIAYHPRALNRHRRHGGSVTASALPPAEALREIAEIQALVAAEFDVSPHTRAVAARYLDELRRQFGLASRI